MRGKSRFGSWMQYPVKVRDAIAVLFLGILFRYLRKEFGNCVAYHYEYKWGALYMVFQISPQLYWLMIALGSECPHPWSPKEIMSRVHGHLYKHWKTKLADKLGKEFVKYVEQHLAGATVIVISSMSVGCYDLFRDWYEDYGKFGTRILGINVRSLARLTKSWNRRLVLEIYKDVSEAAKMLATRIARKGEKVFRMINAHFRGIADRIRRSTEDKIGKAPYGEVAETIKRYLALAASFLAIQIFAAGKPPDEAILLARTSV